MINLNAKVAKGIQIPEGIKVSLGCGKYIKFKCRVITTIRESHINLEDAAFSYNTVVLKLDTQFETELNTHGLLPDSGF